jgi:GNAT superfamily N-acetyltransferase
VSGAPPTVTEVRGGRDLREFIALPFRLYRGDPLWVPPLIAERRSFLDLHRNPFCEHADVALWLARRGSRVVGRLSSHIDHRHNATHGERTGMFGFLECEADAEVAGALLERARAWCHERGADRLRGPLSFSLNHECGLLVDGWDGPPVFMMPYNPPSYPVLLERLGFAKAVDLVTYTLRRSDVAGDAGSLPEELVRRAEAARRQAGVTVRRGDARSFGAEIARGLEIFRAAWRDNWGFVPPTDREATGISWGLRRIVEPRLCYFAERDGTAVGFSMVVVDANQVFVHLGGRLLPFGWLKALWHARRITGLRLLLFGVLAEHRGQGIEAALMLETLRAALAAGYETLELSWILENNMAVRHLLETIGAPYGVRIHRRYRIYEAPLDAAPAAGRLPGATGATTPRER